MPRCFVMQPFDNAEFDRRYDEIYRIAIEASGFDPYRVDRDPGAFIPIQSIENEIRRSAACFVDISVDNPNVWFEFGFAVSALKPICIVSSKLRERFPFDIQHRKVIRYDTKAPSDFIELQKSITERLKSISENEVKMDSQIEQITASNKEHQLSPAEFQVLCVIFEEANSDHDNISFSNIHNGMYRVGYNKLAARVGVAKLQKKEFIKKDNFLFGEDTVWYITDSGRSYILDNVDERSLKDSVSTNDDIPF